MLAFLLLLWWNSDLGRRGFVSSYTSRSRVIGTVRPGSKAGSWKQDSLIFCAALPTPGTHHSQGHTEGQWPLPYCLLASVLTNFLIWTGPTCPGMCCPSCLDLPASIKIIKTILHRHVHRPTWWRQLFNWHSLQVIVSCQVDSTR